MLLCVYSRRNPSYPSDSFSAVRECLHICRIKKGRLRSLSCLLYEEIAHKHNLSTESGSTVINGHDRFCTGGGVECPSMKRKPNPNPNPTLNLKSPLKEAKIIPTRHLLMCTHTNEHLLCNLHCVVVVVQ